MEWTFSLPSLCLPLLLITKAVLSWDQICSVLPCNVSPPPTHTVFAVGQHFLIFFFQNIFFSKNQKIHVNKR